MAKPPNGSKKSFARYIGDFASGRIPREPSLPFIVTCLEDDAVVSYRTERLEGTGDRPEGVELVREDRYLTRRTARKKRNRN